MVYLFTFSHNILKYIASVCILMSSSFHVFMLSKFPAIQRRSLPQVPADSGIKSRAAKSDEGITNRSQLKPKSKIQNLQQPQGNVVARRSKLTAPSSNSSKGVVAR